MADRFPSLEEFDSVGKHSLPIRSVYHCVNSGKRVLGQTGAKSPDLGLSTEDFIAREKAILGDDADQFTGPNDDETIDLGGGRSSAFGDPQEPSSASDSRNPIQLHEVRFFLGCPPLISILTR